MTEQSATPASVEGQKLLITGQDIKPEGIPRFIEKSGDIVFPLNVKKRGSACIIKEYNPKCAKFRQNSMLESGDMISGQWLWGFSSNILKRGDIIVGDRGRTSNHPGQETEIKGDNCLMEIINGWYGTSLPIHPKSNPIVLLKNGTQKSDN